MKKGFSRITWLVFVLFFITSPSLISYSAEKKSPPIMTPKYGGTLVIRVNIPVNMGYPAGMRGLADLDASYIYVESLFRFGIDGKPKPWLATAWKYSSDFKSLTLTLRKDVKFQDGTDFNAVAVKTNLDLCKKVKREELASVSSVDVIDPYTVRLNLSMIDAFLLNNLSEFVGIMISPAALARGDDWCRTNPVGTGPFKLVKYESAVRAEFKKWDGYWQKGKPYLDAIHAVFIPEDMTAAAAFMKGDIHMIYTENHSIAASLKDVSKAAIISSFQVLIFDSAHKDSPFSDMKVRQAIAYAIDTNTLAKSLGGGYWQDNNQITDKSTVYYNSNIIGYPYNLQKAKEILATSKYPNGFKTTLYSNIASTQMLVSTAVQSMLAKIGIEVSIQPITSAASTKLQTDGWQNGSYMRKFTTAIENEPGRYMQTTIAKDSGQYTFVARSAEYDTIFSKLIVEPDFNKRVVLNRQLLKQMFDGECMINFVWQSANFYLTPLNLHGDRRGDPLLHQWEPQDAWFSEK